MKGLMGMIGMTVASAVVGWITYPLVGMVASFILSSIAGGFGMYYAVKWARNNGW